MERMNALVIVFLIGTVVALSYLYYQQARNEISLNIEGPGVPLRTN